MQGNLLRNTSAIKPTNSQTMTQIQYNDLELCNVDFVSSNVKSSQFGAMLHIFEDNEAVIFEDNEAVIKMINKGRSPTMRHVSKLHSIGYLTESTWTQKF